MQRVLPPGYEVRVDDLPVERPLDLPVDPGGASDVDAGTIRRCAPVIRVLASADSGLD